MNIEHHVGGKKCGGCYVRAEVVFVSNVSNEHLTRARDMVKMMENVCNCVERKYGEWSQTQYVIVYEEE